MSPAHVAASRVRHVSDSREDLEREWAFLGRTADPLVRELLALDDPWEAYERGNHLSDLMTDTELGGSFELPHAGSIYVAWAELTDVYETGVTPIADAHAALRLAATRWLDRPAEPSARFIEEWATDARRTAGELFARDGDWWNRPG